MTVSSPITHFPVSRGEAIPVQGPDRPSGLREFEVPSIYRQSTHKSGKVVSSTHPPPLPPGDIPSTAVLISP
jgi:hypothetical protein